MFIMRRKQWRVRCFHNPSCFYIQREDEEFAKEQARRAKEKHGRRVRKNRERRQEREEEEMRGRMAGEREEEDKLARSIRGVLVCVGCGASLVPTSPIHSCGGGHGTCTSCVQGVEEQVRRATTPHS